VIDVISPCVTFADHEGSTKSYAAVKQHDTPLHDIDYVPYYEDLTVDYEPGTTREVTMPDGSHIVLKKLAEDYDPTDPRRALAMLHEARAEQKLLTGLYYVEPRTMPYEDDLGLIETPLASLPLEKLRPPKRVLEAEAHNLRIRWVLETHLHADFVSGHLELASRTGATIGIGARAEAAFPHRALRDGDAIPIGRASLRAIETPGHTPESISYLVY